MDPNYVEPKKPDCGDKEYKGDGNCDDNNNLPTCDWDGGDCCKDKKKLYCTEVCGGVVVEVVLNVCADVNTRDACS